MNSRTSFKRIFITILMFVVMINHCTVIHAEGRKIEPAESRNYTKTFENNTEGGILYLKDSNGKTLKKLEKGEKISYDYPNGESPEEIKIEAIADKGYVVESYLAMWFLDGKRQDTCESMYHINKGTYKRGHFLKTAEFDEVFSVSFIKEEDIANAEEEESMTTFLASAKPDIDNPKTGDVYTGTATLTYNGKKTEYYNGTGYITCTSGDFEGDQITLQNCASGHDYWAPQTGQTGTYKITITKIDKNTGKITCKIEWINSKHTEGYQNLSGSFSYYHSFDGTITVYKEMGEIEGSFVMTSSLKSQLDFRAGFEIYGDKKCTIKLGSFSTDSGGRAVLSLEPGTYYVKEVAAPRGFALNPTVFTLKVTADSSKSLTVKDNLLRAKISGVKIDSRTGKSVPTKGLSLAGAVYNIYEDKDCTIVVNTGISDKDGNITFDKEYLGWGVYYIKEVKPPTGYEIDPVVYEVVINEKNGFYEGSTYRLKDVTFTSEEEPDIGKGMIVKKSANETLTNGNSCYSLKGCKFQLTSVTTKEVLPEILVTDEQGNTQEVTLAVGEYTIKEIEAPKGFELSKEEPIIRIEKNKIKIIEFFDQPSNDPAGVRLKKVDEETNTELPTGAGELSGAEYTFKYYDGYYTTKEQLNDVVPKRTWTLVTDKNGEINFLNATKISGDDFYFIGNIRVIPLGTLTIQETKPPEGYNKNDTLHIQNISADSKGGIIESDQISISPEPVIRGDLKGLKVSGGDMKRLAGIPFKITSVTNGENHVVVTDANGTFDTSSSFNLHSTNTNRGKTSKDGVWFGDISKLDDNMGALPYGSYIIEELPCDANKDKILIEPFEIAVTKNTPVDLGTLVNEYIPVPKIGTRATEKNTNLQVAFTDKETTITDEVDYTNLTKGEKYTIKGTLMDKITKKPLIVNGKQVTAQKNFEPQREYGVINLEFTFDSDSMKGKEVVVFEYLYLNGKEVASHADITDSLQTVRFANPSISTSAMDKASGKRTAIINKNTTVVDEIIYKNIIPGKEYTIKGIIMDTDTGKPFLTNGKQVISEKTFIAKETKGHSNLEFIFDSSSLKNKGITVFEYLYFGDTLIASHADVKNETQTVHFFPPEQPPERPKQPKTGDLMNHKLLFAFFIMGIVGTRLFGFRFNRNQTIDKKRNCKRKL
ncbi:MAG: VaFE repeat-containing surface-anchored protein [Lachnospiraceae bacterium]|nr:VaFE repeat-containing surface-anchored protein [Lachnospiraceae bacterium]